MERPAPMAPATSLRRKVMWVVMSTTLLALVISSAALLVYELRAYRSGWVDDLATQADLIARSSAPALAFDDARAAGENLRLLRLRPQIEAAAVYRADGRLFARYSVLPDGQQRLPSATPPRGWRFVGDELELTQEVEESGEVLGYVYLRARHDVAGRLKDYAAIVLLVMLASLGLAALISSRLQDAVTRPILAVADAAHEVVAQRDYALRVPRTTDDEVGMLVDAFNNMLGEVGRRTEALERTNRELSVEMVERHKAEQALRAADRRKDAFLATLAHELRNPLAPIANALEILRRAETDPALAKRARDIMQRQLRQMARLIDDLIDVSRITTGKLELRRETTDLVSAMRGALETVEPIMRERRHHLVTRWPDQPVWVDGDATRLAQVFANLLTNAARYTEPGGSIGVVLDPLDANAVVSITDTGIGIDANMQSVIFEMFMQVDQSIERGGAGLGVGLTLARQLVELHGGTIAVYSAGLGRGSTFTVTLPLADASPVQAEPALASGIAAPGLDVLVADDNTDFATSLGTMLEALGHSVRVVFDGQAALDEASINPPDVGFFDIGMPRLNGYDLARRLRAQDSTRDITLVAITGWGQEADRERAREAGFDHHFVKPVELDRVVELLRMRTAA